MPSGFWQAGRDKRAGWTAILSPEAGKKIFLAIFFAQTEKVYYICTPIRRMRIDMVDVAQLVRASDCGSEGRGFEPLLPPQGAKEERCRCRRGKRTNDKKPYVSMIRKAFLFLSDS